MPLHAEQSYNHRLETWVYANASARTSATGFVTGDLGKIAYQTDTGEYYRLTATTPTWVIISNISTSVDIQVFSSNGTWTKPANAKSVLVVCIGAGGGGGSGRKGTVAGNTNGGGGGSCGGWMQARFPASILGSTETVTVGVGGTGGTSISANATNGNAGNAGGNSSFGSWLVAVGGLGGHAGGQGSGAQTQATASMALIAGGGNSKASAAGTAGNRGF